MKKDIEIPEVKDVFLAVVREENEDFRSMDWNAYLVNDSSSLIDTVLIVTRGFSDQGKGQNDSQDDDSQDDQRKFFHIEDLNCSRNLKSFS